MLTGEDKLRSRNVVPRNPFLSMAGRMGLGAWEAGIRRAELDFKSDDPLNFFDGILARIPGGGGPPKAAPRPSAWGSIGI